MKKVIVAFALLFGLSAAAVAQGQGKGKGQAKSQGQGQGQGQKTPEERAKAISEKWQKELGLTDEQKQKFYDAKLGQLQKRKDILAKNNGDKKAAQAELKSNKEAFVSTVKSILSPEQYTKWEQKRKEMADKRKQQGQGQGGANKGKKPAAAPAPAGEDEEDDE